ncbi:MAG: energy transducer TonB [Chloracidobacterium sp.]|nr:energy transducer TonB [Chloracidobacterium sp.]
MSEFTIAILLVALLSVPAQDSTLEEKAVYRVQQTPASRYDPALPSRSFRNWLNQVVGHQTGVSWRLGECIEQENTASGWEEGIPACVEATAILPDDRKIVTQIHVGSFKQGLSMTTRFHFAAIEIDSKFQNVPKLSDLPQLIRDPLSAKRLVADKGRKQIVVALPQIKLDNAPQFYYAKSPALVSLPKMIAGYEAETPPPPTPSPRVSKGAIGGDALYRAQPIYPEIAKQINASGDVEVEITIDEKGRVTAAKAVKGPPLLRGAAEDAARKWLFRPTLLDGTPVRQTGVLTFVFTPLR